MVETNSIAEYIKRNEARRNIYTRYSEGCVRYYHRGRWIGRDRYEKLYPVYEYRKNNYKGDNPNKRAVW